MDIYVGDCGVHFASSSNEITALMSAVRDLKIAAKLYVLPLGCNVVLLIRYCVVVFIGVERKYRQKKKLTEKPMS